VQSELLDFGENTGPVIVAHVVSDEAFGWDRRGTAGKLAARYPQAWPHGLSAPGRSHIRRTCDWDASTLSTSATATAQ
jgi:hypothetical protein